MRKAETKGKIEADAGQGPLDPAMAVVQTVDGQRLAQGPVHRMPRMQRCVRILKYHLHQTRERQAAAALDRLAVYLDPPGGDRRQAADGPQHR